MCNVTKSNCLDSERATLLTKPTGLTGLSEFTDDLPIHAVMTDDPMRARMLAAHWLDDAKVIYELRGMIGYTGTYLGVPLTLLSSGFGDASAIMYLHDARLLGMQRVFYIGECISHARGIKLRDVIIATGGDPALMQCALAAAGEHSIPVAVHAVATHESVLADDTETRSDITDFASEAISKYTTANGIAALSILTVSQNTATGERIEEHERQSRFHAASKLVFEALALDGRRQQKASTRE